MANAERQSRTKAYYRYDSSPRWACIISLFGKWSVNSSLLCDALSFTTLELFGAEILAIRAAPKYNSTELNVSPFGMITVSYCAANVTYTHPGYNDTIVVIQMRLPLSGWNGRFLGLGGGGFVMGNFLAYGAAAVQQGYAVAITDGGHDIITGDPSLWTLKSPGNVNYPLFIDFASRALDDLPKISKQVIKSFYGKPPSYSYWRGCSTGGRQGLMSAQRYPDNYDGILAEAPAAYWTRFLTGDFFPAVIMNEEGYYPENCELDGFTAAATKACDELDNVKDGIIAAPELCHYDPHSSIGQSFDCHNITKTLTAQGANVVAKIWQGVFSGNGSFLWYPFSRGTNLTSVANITECAYGTRGPNPFSLAEQWLQYFVLKDPNVNIRNLTYDGFESLFHKSIQEYESIIGTSDADLSAFKNAGGKMITWHGTQDELIPTDNSVEYWSNVNGLISGTDDFYRLFLGPGLAHCGPSGISLTSTGLSGGKGYYPTDPLGSLIEWVEKGVAPATLSTIEPSTNHSQPLCPYPLVAKWDGKGDSGVATSYTCAESY
ncbi:Tannase/feruloyl esterase [Leptodontidium sp. MPI-SDFR-AT-0119]|nr:Tannase/feruloyl esterase [Leptodontidium sp. MPI-SDFR-AT-0119]